LRRPGQETTSQVFYDSATKFTPTPSQNVLMSGSGSGAMSMSSASGGGRGLAPGRAPPEECGPMSPKLKAEQERFQVDDDVPVYLKAGARDKVLLGITVALALVGLGLSGQFVYESAFPQIKKDAE